MIVQHLSTSDLLRAMRCKPLFMACVHTLYYSVALSDRNIASFLVSLRPNLRPNSFMKYSPLIFEVAYQSSCTFGADECARAHSSVALIREILRRLPNVISLTLDTPLLWSLQFRTVFWKFIFNEPADLSHKRAVTPTPPPEFSDEPVLMKLQSLYIHDRVMIPLCFGRPIVRLSLRLVLSDTELYSILSPLVSSLPHLRELEFIIEANVDVPTLLVRLIRQKPNMKHLVITRCTIHPQVSNIFLRCPIHTCTNSSYSSRCPH